MRTLFPITVLALALGLLAGCGGEKTTGNRMTEKSLPEPAKSVDDPAEQRAIRAGLVPSLKAPMAPDWTLKDTKGRTVKLSDFRGKVVILDFWDTWCPPCRKEIPGFIKLQEAYGGKGLQVIGAAIGQEGEAAVKKFAAEWKMNYPVVLAEPGVVREYGGIRSIPTTFVIDITGRARAMHVGYVDASTFEREVLALLPEG